MYRIGQKGKYSLRADVFRFGPEPRDFVKFARSTAVIGFLDWKNKKPPEGGLSNTLALEVR
jgi:hypothetical protein